MVSESKLPLNPNGSVCPDAKAINSGGWFKVVLSETMDAFLTLSLNTQKIMKGPQIFYRKI